MALSLCVSLVTGAASGIGRSVAMQLVQGGVAGLIAVDRNAQALQQLAAELGETTVVLALPLDVCSETDMVQMAEAVKTRFGRIDHLVCCAGILRPTPELKFVADTSLDEWRRVIDVNLTGTFLSVRAVLGMMASQKCGEIVAVSSVSARQGRAYDAAYAASKAGIIGFAESLAEEVSSQGIRVQTILPDAVDTPLWQQNGAGAFVKPPAAMNADHVAAFIVQMLMLPRDTMLQNPVLVPFRQRRQGRK